MLKDRRKIISTFFIFIFILTVSPLYSQQWKESRQSITSGIGTSHFMGDLGGGANDAAHFLGVRDLDFVTTRPTLTAYYRYRLHQQIASKVGFTYAKISANDAASGSIGRQYRNLNFRSNIWEFSANFEFYFLKEQEISRYSFSNIRSFRYFSAYFVIGVGAFYFNPQAKLDGTWHKLRTLGTEGQGLTYTDPVSGQSTQGPELYSRIAFALPIGLGFKYQISRKLSVGLEITNRYTTTDYLDDASNLYFDNQTILDQKGPIAAQLADRHIDYFGDPTPVPYENGKPMRGSPDYNDAYVLTTAMLIYRIDWTPWWKKIDNNPKIPQKVN